MIACACCVASFGACARAPSKGNLAPVGWAPASRPAVANAAAPKPSTSDPTSGRSAPASQPAAADAAAKAPPDSDPASGGSASPLQPTAAHATAPELIGHLVGPGAQLAQPTLSLYGADLGFSFEHRDRLFMLFGDTMPTPLYYCATPQPVNDDSIALLPKAIGNGAPALEFLTSTTAPNDFSPCQLLSDGLSLALGLGQTPMTGFSDGDHAFAAFNRDDYVRCAPSPDGQGSCAGFSGLTCSSNVGECQPMIVTPALCDLAGQQGCKLGQVCTPSVTGFCIDRSSSEYDGSARSEPFAVAHTIAFAIQRDDRPDLYDAAFALSTNKFHNVTSRTVQRWSGQRSGSDYGPGHGALLVWGRPGFTGEQGRQAQLYLMTHPLPLTLGANGSVDFRPRYFAGIDGASGEPRWSDEQRDAQPLALDGGVGGDPHEDLVLVNQMAISWLGPPIDRWLMIYGGDLPDWLLADPNAARSASTPGAVMMRFADYPWGPWTPPQPLLAPGDPSLAGDAYGPGGFLYHVACQDAPGASCARTDPIRPIDSLLPSCQSPSVQTDVGRLYGSNIIDAYTAANGDDGLDVFWNLSTWNPYGVVLLKTTFRR